MQRILVPAAALAALVLSSLVVATSATGASAAERVVPRAGHVVTLHVNDDQPMVRSRLVFTGTLRSLSGTESVALQLHRQGKKGWRTLKTKQVRRSTFHFKDVTTKAGKRAYRLRAGTGSVVYSKPVRLTVRRDIFLNTLEPAARSGVTGALYADIGGTTYADVIQSSGATATDFAEWDLQGKCSELVLAYGVTDASPAASQAQLSLLADGVPLLAQTVSRGSAATAQRYDVTGVQRLRFQVQTTTGAVGAMAGPYVSCSF